ncbi:Uncharacterised protein [Mycobacteroides abscessus subsp. massiliense]|nr:Uncharacterised protein [Mycobacteroides abscessus subsp. massiliense]
MRGDALGWRVLGDQLADLRGGLHGQGGAHIALEVDQDVGGLAVCALVGRCELRV